MNLKMSLFIILFTILLETQIEEAVDPLYLGELTEDHFEQLMNIEVGYPKSFSINSIIKNNISTQSITAKPLKFDSRVVKQEIICGIKHMALSFMKLLEKVIMYNQYSVNEEIGSIYIGFEQIAHQMVVIVYNLGVANMTDMWFFYCYITEVSVYWYDNTKYIPNEDNLTDIHQIVLNKLSGSMSNCTKPCHFDVTNTSSQFFDEYTKTDRYSLALELMDKFVEAIENCLCNYWEHPISYENSSNLFYDRIYLNPKIMFPKIFYNIHNIYLGENIEWGTAQSELDNSFRLASSSKKFLNNFKELDIFYSMYIKQMTIIMLRLLWCHVILIEHYVDISITKFPFITMEEVNTFVKIENFHMCDVFIDFLNIFDIKHDSYFKDIIDLLTVRSTDYSYFLKYQKIIINVLQKQLKNLCDEFIQCDASNVEDVKKDIVEFSELFEKIHTFGWDYLGEPQVFPETLNIVLKNIRRTSTFVHHLRVLLEDVDFNILYSLVDFAQTTS